MALTAVRFAQQCAYIAKNASVWGAEALDNGASNESIDATIVARFTDSVRDRLTRLDELAGRAALAKAEGEGK